MSKKKDNKKSFKETLNLPKTDFSIRANAKTKEPELLERWREENMYANASEENKETKKTFSLHDGPPFANGHMHMGHALNRTLKDIICKYKRMSGYKIISYPGWDCHGLPIELKVVKELEGAVDRVTVKQKCRAYAQRWIDIQKDEIKRLGVVTDWDHPYITMSPQYESAILKSFATFVEKGYIERKGKTVPWCASCQTVLATAEIEYQDKKDPSCYILFPLDQEAKKIFPEIFEKNPELDINLLVWTTNPCADPTLQDTSQQEFLDLDTARQPLCDSRPIQTRHRQCPSLFQSHLGQRHHSFYMKIFLVRSFLAQARQSSPDPNIQFPLF